ncbi:solute carrier, DMT family [Galdieria sulphuraria]|uniref:Solute carrier, DMT family n=1 Tax=Galdieria sulphuraria TaxID=130081 RepID=M2Y7P0_GALSU|nr:solute carrier, DMT family [Galdieria sulphuraria]EME32093.1 solute carrier, DMT family [Galdieria sulphuraria]|eukprot:XP_005708613.1 solute carrier, DMT family [Galdieria sulphuraria]
MRTNYSEGNEVMENIQYFMANWKFHSLTLLLVVSWYGISTTIILLTKWAVSEVPGFEFPLLITTTNNLGAFVWSFLFIRFVVNNIPHCSKERLLYSFFPVSVGIALEIGLSNIALSLLSVALSTLLKGSAPLFVMFWGLLLGTEVFKLNLFFSIGLICLGLALTSVGNYAGNTLGIILQLTAVAAGGFRWCLMQILLQRRGDEHRVSALELTYYTAPLTALVLFPFVVGLEGKSFVAYLTNTASSQVAYMILILLLISTFVFLLLIVEYLLVRRTSSLAMAVAAVFKEGTTIVGGAIWFHDRLSIVNVVGFVVCQMGILWILHY